MKIDIEKLQALRDALDAAIAESAAASERLDEAQQNFRAANKAKQEAADRYTEYLDLPAF